MALLAGMTTLAEPAKVSSNLSDMDFEVGEKAYTSGDYIWTEIPEDLRGFGITRWSLGCGSSLDLKVKKPGTVYLVVARMEVSGLKETGWEEIGQAKCDSDGDCKYPLAVIMSKEFEEKAKLTFKPSTIQGIRLLIP